MLLVIKNWNFLFQDFWFKWLRKIWMVPWAIESIPSSSLPSWVVLFKHVLTLFLRIKHKIEPITTIDTIKTSSNTQLAIKGIVRTMYDPRNNLATDVSMQLLKFFYNHSTYLDWKFCIFIGISFKEFVVAIFLASYLFCSVS